MMDDIGADAMSSWIRDEVFGVILQYRMQEQLPTFFLQLFHARVREASIRYSTWRIRAIESQADHGTNSLLDKRDPNDWQNRRNSEI